MKGKLCLWKGQGLRTRSLLLQSWSEGRPLGCAVQVPGQSRVGGHAPGAVQGGALLLHHRSKCGHPHPSATSCGRAAHEWQSRRLAVLHARSSARCRAWRRWEIPARALTLLHVCRPGPPFNRAPHIWVLHSECGVWVGPLTRARMCRRTPLGCAICRCFKVCAHSSAGGTVGMHARKRAHTPSHTRAHTHTHTHTHKSHAVTHTHTWSHPVA